MNVNDQITKSEEEIIQILGAIGLKTNEARVLVIFLRGKELTSREIERHADLRQPEVSIAITALTKRKWVATSSLITENKGRPIKVFSLTKPVDEILNQIKSQIFGDYSKQIAYVERVRDLVQDFHQEKENPIIEA